MGTYVKPVSKIRPGWPWQPLSWVWTGVPGGIHTGRSEGDSHFPSKVDEQRQDIDTHYPAVSHLSPSLSIFFLNAVSSQAGGVPSGL